MDIKEQDQKIQNMIINMGLSSSPQFTYIPDVEGLRYTIVQYMGVNTVILLINEWIMINVNFAYVPKTNVAPFYRRLLTLNADLFLVKFAIVDSDSQVRATSSRHLDGLDPVEFRQMLELTCRAYLDQGVKLVQEFQLPQQPG